MSKSVKYGLIVTALNFVFFLILVPIADRAGLETGLFLLLVVPAIVLLVELILGIVFVAATTAKKDPGSGLLIGCGLTLLIILCGWMVLTR